MLRSIVYQLTHRKGWGWRASEIGFLLQLRMPTLKNIIKGRFQIQFVNEKQEVTK